MAVAVGRYLAFYLAAGVLAATVIDLRTRRIPNGLTAAMTGIGIALSATDLSNFLGCPFRTRSSVMCSPWSGRNGIE